MIKKLLHPGEFDDYLNTRRRKRSEESIVFDNHYQTRAKTLKHEDPVKSKLCQAPRNIAKNQKMLKTGLLNLQGGPLFFERLELKIPEMRYNSQCKTKEEVIFPNAKFNEGRKKSGNHQDKWKGWNKQLRSSLKYWQKRFPCTELTHCSHSIRK